METGYQRGRIQEEGLLYEHQKHSGELPIVGVNTFLNPEEKGHEKTTLELARSNSDEKNDLIKRLRDFHASHFVSRHSREGGKVHSRLKCNT